jgi:prevent-host-death family protein
MNVNVGEARDNLTRLIAAVERGERVTICRQGKPVVDLVRTATPVRRTRKFGTLRDRIRILDPNWAKAMTDDEVDAMLEGRS